MRNARFAAHKLCLVASAPQHSEKLVLGDRVRLNSGGPVGLVVDYLESDEITVAWGGEEKTLPRVCFSRARPSKPSRVCSSSI